VKQYLTRIKTLEWENRNLKQVAQKKDLEIEGFKVQVEMQRQANEGLFRELEITIEHARPDNSNYVDTP
jgi:uncharacterized OsmC-like protein